MVAPLTLTKISKTYDWQVAESYTFSVGEDNQVFTIDPGFITDLTSVPGFLWSVFPPSGIYTEAAVEHDYLYAAAVISRKDADLHFKVRLEELGVGFICRSVMYWAVRLFGKIEYDNNND